MQDNRKERNMLKSKQIVLPIAALLIIVGSASAQPPKMESKGAKEQGMHGCMMSEHKPMIPDLTEKQQEQIKTLRLEHMQAMKSLRNELGEKKARLRTLTTSDKVNMTEVNKVIDDIGRLQTQMMKLRVQHQQSIRELLTDEQRVFFDSHQPPHDGPRHEGMHPGKGMD
jgi:Spy/CpxP family protein refolding chaperone